MSSHVFKRKPGEKSEDMPGVQGYLEKKGAKHTRGHRPRWSQRYFRLQGNMLVYYRDSEAAERASSSEERKALQALEPPKIMERARKLLKKNEVTEDEFQGAIQLRDGIPNHQAVAARQEALIELIVTAEARKGHINLQKNPRVGGAARRV